VAGAEKLWRGADRVALWLDRERNAWLVMGAGMAIFAFLAMYLTRGTTVFLDEGNLFSVSRGYDLTSLLSPLNGHFVFMVRLLYATVFKLWNADFVVLRLADVAGAWSRAAAARARRLRR